VKIVGQLRCVRDVHGVCGMFMVCAANFAIRTHLVCGVCAKVCTWCVEVCKADMGCAHLVCAVQVILKYASVEV
jgi:hypothetical protein